MTYAEVPYRAQRTKSGFFSTLFDFTFTRFVTLSFVRVIFVIGVVLAVLGWVAAVIGPLLAGGPEWIAGLLVGWVPSLLFIVLLRVALEFSVAMIRTAQNTSDIVRARY